LKSKDARAKVGWSCNGGEPVIDTDLIEDMTHANRGRLEA